MNVGVYLGNFQPDAGGFYTLTHQIFLGLKRIAHESDHTFYIISHNQASCCSSDNNLLFVSLPRKATKVCFIKLFYLFKALIRKIGYPDRLFYIENVYNAILEKNNIEILWCLTQHSLSMDFPYIVTLLDLEHLTHPYFPEVSRNNVWNEREKKFHESLRRAVYIITGTNAGKDQIHSYYQVDKQKIKVLPYPVPDLSSELIDEGIVTTLNQYAIPKDFLFYPAQFWPHKNHIGLLYALSILKEKHKLIIPVVFVGSDKGNLNYIKTTIKDLNLLSQVYILGFVPLDVLTSLYKKALALVFPTFFGPDNLPPLEAFKLGCPVLASKVAGANEQLGEAALLFDPNNPLEIATAIKSIYENFPLRNKLIQKGYERAAKFNVDDYVRSVFQLLDKFENIRKCWS